MIVAVDGPAGSGKSTICSEVCHKIGWNYINTGFFYRALAYIVKHNGIDVNDDQAVAEALQKLSEQAKWNAEDATIFLGDENITEHLIDNKIGRLASDLAKKNMVREALLPIQRNLINTIGGGVIVDGRDIGTIVYPNAPLKVFMTASLEARAKRRYLQLEEKGLNPNLQQIKNEIDQRDNQDKTRDIAPLAQASDAVVLDSSNLTKEETVSKLKELIDGISC